MKNFVRVSQAILCLLAAASAHAQGFWQKKDYQKWSKDEVREVLRDSPWARTYTVGQVLIQALQENAAVSGRETNPQITYLAQIWSARPIREALVRQEQLSGAAGKLPAEQKAALLEKEAKFIAADFPQTVIVELIYGSSSQALDQDLTRYWQSQSPEMVKQFTYLIAGSRRIAPLQVGIGKGARHEIQLTFPRQVDGQPIVSSDDKHIALQLQHPTIGVLPAQAVYIEFDLKRMTLNGQVVY